MEQEFLAVKSNYQGMIDFIVETALQAGVAKALQLEFALEEFLVNIISYAYPEGEPGKIMIRLYSDEKKFHVCLIDAGKPFDPLNDAPKVDEQLELEDMPIGGLGIFLTRQFIDDISYKRENERNILNLTFALK